MCNYKTMVNNEWGYVVRCNNCQHFQVAFGNTVLRLTGDEFLLFANEVDEKLHHHAPTCCKQSKTIYIDTALRSISLVYTFDELSRLRSILHTATEKIRKEKLFTFCNN